MRILQISSAQSLGGGERHLADLAGGLIERGHDVFVALRSQAALRSELDKVAKKNIATLPLRNSLDVNSARALAALVRDNDIQIIHAHMARDYPLAAYAARRNPAARLILTRHVLFPLNRLHRLTFSGASRIIAVSEAVASQLRADKVAPAEKITVVMNGIDTGRFARARKQFDRQEFLKSWKLPESSALIGTLGELTPLKGHQDFLRAAGQISKQIAGCTFIIAGIDHSPDGKNEAEIEKLIDELKLRQQVRRVKWLDDLAQFYCALDVFVSASHTESFGLAIVEAMASGTAVVATETEGARETVRDKETGLLIPIGTAGEMAVAIQSLLSDESTRRRLAAAAQKDVAERFSVGRMVAETEDVYRASLQ
ncbi:MAG TPA: glycosyltransferase family 4 protein [Pyrinomonadaceae bacterium]|nr:glycosyltransferase family 4 protein [Pyrinomonadaceae bacterium]